MGLEVNKKLLPIKGHYFLLNAGNAPVNPFVPVIIRQLGYSSTVVGTIYTILPMALLIAKPILGAIADRFQKHKLFFILFQFLLTFFYFSIMFVPEIPQSSPVKFHCDNGAADFQKCYTKNEPPFDKCIINKIKASEMTTLNCQLNCSMEPWMWDTVCTYWNESKYCPYDKTKNLEFTADVRMDSLEVLDNCLYFLIKTGTFSDGSNAPLYCPHKNSSDKYFNTNCETACDNQLVAELLTVTKIPDNEVFGLYQFWILFLLLIFGRMFLNIVISLSDVICYEMLGKDRDLYGQQRVWGSIGWGLLSVISGIIIDNYSKETAKKDYTIVFYMMVVIMFCDMIVSSRLDYTQTKKSTNMVKDIGKTFSSFKMFIFFLWCIWNGIGSAAIWNFLLWHLETLAGEQEGCNHMNSMKTLQGIVMGIQCFGGELPFFFLSGWILKKMGHINAMSLVLLGSATRFLLYSVLSNPWWVLPVESLNGITFGLFYATMTSYTSMIAPSGTEATMQGVVGAVFQGIGLSSGSFLSGLLFDKIGGSGTYRVFGIVSLVLFIVHVIIQKLLDKTNEKAKRDCDNNLALERLKENDTDHIVFDSKGNDTGDFFKDIDLNK